MGPQNDSQMQSPGITEHSNASFSQFDWIEAETSNIVDQSLFSNFDGDARLTNTKAACTILQLVLNHSNNKHKTSCFYKLKENTLKRTSQLKCFSFSYTPQLELYGENFRQPNNPEVDFLPLISKFSLFEGVQAAPASTKDLKKEVFLLRLENQQLKKKAERLESEVAQAIRRQQREVLKKQESLQGLMEELMEKNQIIQQLRSNLNLIEARMKSKEKIILNCMLEQDQQSLRKALNRIESVNDRLNFNLEQARNRITYLQKQKRNVQEKCQELQKEVKQLKQHNFDLENHRETVEMMKKQAEIVGKRFNGKMEKVKKLEKKLSLVVKSSTSLQDSKSENQSDLKTSETNNSGIKRSCSLNSVNSIKEEIGESKLESVLNFLFHISAQGYQLEQQELFDEQERQLLKTHKQLFNKNKGIHNVERDNYFQATSIFGESLDQAFNSSQQKAQHQERKKIASLQNKCQNLTGEICQLKQKLMYNRQIVLDFLRLLKLSSLKKETENILGLICEMFEYSETEIHQFFQPKSRKFFGLI